MPWQLTVGELRRVISDAPDEVVVGLALPPGTPSDARFTVLLNVKVSYPGGPIVRLSPRVEPLPSAAAQSPAIERIDSAGNTLVPAILVLEDRGFVVTRNTDGETETWRARRGDTEAVGDDPLQLLGLVALLDARGQDWKASDIELEGAVRRFNLES